MDEVIKRVEATIHKINGHWWNRRTRPAAPDLAELLERLKALDRIKDQSHGG